MPFEARLSFLGVIGQPEPSVPGWYTVSKRGLYKGDIAYGLSFQRDSGELHVLLPSRQLKPKKRKSDEDIGRDTKARCLLSPVVCTGKPQALVPLRGNPRHRYRNKTFVSGLLLMTLKLNQVIPVANPSPYQIALHVASTVDHSFMVTTYQSYNRQFWKTNDRVIISDSVYYGQVGVLIEIERENGFATVLLSDGTEYSSSMSNLRRSFRIGDVVRVIEDSFSDAQNVYHNVLGHFGAISFLDFETEEITVMESNQNQVRRLVSSPFCPNCPRFPPSVSSSLFPLRIVRTGAKSLGTA